MRLIVLLKKKSKELDALHLQWKKFKEKRQSLKHGDKDFLTMKQREKIINKIFNMIGNIDEQIT